VDADVTSERDRERALQSAMDKFSAVDVLVNNAAIAPSLSSSSTRRSFIHRAGRVAEGVRSQRAWHVPDDASHGPHLLRRAWERIINMSTRMAAMLAQGVLPYGP
jgi:NAD(P)-dependent dehydrogenase (short-subunit alcohol dehydrogenase family)